jgi:methylthioxylose transferase
LLCILVGSSAAVAVAVTLRALGAEATARATLPFGVLLPGVIWIGVSADGLFAGVLAWGVALLALGAARPRFDILAAAVSLTGGLLLGATLFLSYGLVLAGLLPVADTGGTDCCPGTPRRHAIPAGLRRAHQLPVAPAPHTTQRDQQKGA